MSAGMPAHLRAHVHAPKAFGVRELKKDQAVLVRTPEKKAELMRTFKCAEDGGQGGRVMTINEAKGCEFEDVMMCGPQHD